MRKRDISRTDLSQYMYKAVAENEHEALYWKDIDSKFILVSKFLVKMFGLNSMDEVIGRSDIDFFSKDYAEQSLEDEQNIIRTGKPLLGKIESDTFPDGSITWMATSKFPLKDIDGNIIGTWGHSIDIGESRRSETPGRHKIAHLTERELAVFDKSSIDQLTQLPNVKKFYEYINLFYQDAMNTLSMNVNEHVLMLIDVDNLQKINDAYGLECGDKALIHVARIIEKGIREKDHAYRFEGDEFALLLKVFDYPEAIEIADRLLKQIAETPLTCGGDELKFTASIGISMFKEKLPYGTIYDIINHTEMRVTRAKSTGCTSISDDEY